MTPTLYAKDLGGSLIAAGFVALPANASAQAGDVAVIQPIPGHPAGHTCMFDGKLWISDFKQLHGFYPGPGYRADKPPYVIYRHR